jgi:hypothetical protein
MRNGRGEADLGAQIDIYRYRPLVPGLGGVSYTNWGGFPIQYVS